VAARRRVLQLIGDKQAVEILFDEIAPRFADRDGGYTRILRLAKPRLGDSGTRAVLELVGRNDRERRAAAAPAFESDIEDEESSTATATATESGDTDAVVDASAPEPSLAEEPTAEKSADEPEEKA
jgi:large subunit ribosomal protein L17